MSLLVVPHPNIPFHALPMDDATVVATLATAVVVGLLTSENASTIMLPTAEPATPPTKLPA